MPETVAGRNMMRSLRKSIAAKLIMTVTVLAVVAVAVAIVVHYQSQRLTDTAKWTAHTHKVLESTESALHRSGQAQQALALVKTDRVQQTMDAIPSRTKELADAGC